MAHTVPREEKPLKTADEILPQHSHISSFLPQTERLST